MNGYWTINDVGVPRVNGFWTIKLMVMVVTRVNGYWTINDVGGDTCEWILDDKRCWW